MRDKISVPAEAGQVQVEELAKNSEAIKKWLVEGQIKKRFSFLDD